MNIFALDDNPVEAARLMCNSHVVKMCVESAQLLSTCTSLLVAGDREQSLLYRALVAEGAIYRPTHDHHPCVKWLTESVHNREWLRIHTEALSQEYWERYGRAKGRVHASRMPAHRVVAEFPEIFSPARPEPDWRLHTRFALGFMGKYPELASWSDDPVECYREFYRRDKVRFAKWSAPRSKPEWF